ncbi:unnamed protein product, partial [Strongylus vulgaris]
MSEDRKPCADVKCEEYTPGYLSTNQAFDPQTASFFYESGECSAATNESSSSSHRTVKAESTEKPFKIVTVKKEVEDSKPPPQRIPSREYLEAQRQYQQNLLHRQQYLLTSGVSQDHKEHQNGRVAATPNFIQFPGGASLPPNHCYPHTAIYPQQHAVHANVPYPVVVPGRPLGSRVAAVPQRLPPHMIMQSRYTAGVQPAPNYVSQGIPMRPGVQYPNVPVRYMPYEGEMEAPVYIPAQGQVTMPPGTVIYTRDGCPVEGEEEDVGTKRRRTGKRKKENVDDEWNQQKDAVGPTGPPAPLTHGELLKQKKRNMAFP